jgi:hypothetical protein
VVNLPVAEGGGNGRAQQSRPGPVRDAGALGGAITSILFNIPRRLTRATQRE